MRLNELDMTEWDYRQVRSRWSTVMMVLSAQGWPEEQRKRYTHPSQRYIINIKDLSTWFIHQMQVNDFTLYKLIQNNNSSLTKMEMFMISKVSSTVLNIVDNSVFVDYDLFNGTKFNHTEWRSLSLIDLDKEFYTYDTYKFLRDKGTDMFVKIRRCISDSTGRKLEFVQELPNNIRLYALTYHNPIKGNETLMIKLSENDINNCIKNPDNFIDNLIHLSQLREGSIYK
jgi:hypothetical protein